MDKVVKSEAEWQAELTADQYAVCRCKGTERPFTGEYYDNHQKGVYSCCCCQLPLFSSETKYESGSGWPSYYAPVDAANVSAVEDRTHGMIRTEVLCGRCGSHLGHVFPDGPPPTGLRYCINSVALDFTPDSDES